MELDLDMEQKFLVDAALLQAVLEYLATRPFREVRRLIEALELSQPVAQQSKPDDTSPE